MTHPKIGRSTAITTRPASVSEGVTSASGEGLGNPTVELAALQRTIVNRLSSPNVLFVSLAAPKNEDISSTRRVLILEVFKGKEAAFDRSAVIISSSLFLYSILFEPVVPEVTSAINWSIQHSHL